MSDRLTSRTALVHANSDGREKMTGTAQSGEVERRDQLDRPDQSRNFAAGLRRFGSAHGTNRRMTRGSCKLAATNVAQLKS